ncbi:MAG: NAD(P)H-binding protein [Flavobacteriales bacterium]|nr:NAD(P)H-binding protein [Flavobacteriales bacterium]
MKTILLAGATGLIGNEVLEQLLIGDGSDRVITLSRRPIEKGSGSFEQWVANDLLSALTQEPVDAVICCLGTTMRNVGGDKQRFIHVDKDLVLGLGRWAKAQGVRTFIVVSSMGADPGSRFFYNRVKGEMEEGLKAIGLPTLHIFQPSILTGPRKERRTGERIGIAVMNFLSPLLPARLRPMPHVALAKAIINALRSEGSGTYLGPEILALADQK